MPFFASIIYATLPEPQDERKKDSCKGGSLAPGPTNIAYVAQCTTSIAVMTRTRVLGRMTMT